MAADGNTYDTLLKARTAAFSSNQPVSNEQVSEKISTRGSLAYTFSFTTPAASEGTGQKQPVRGIANFQNSLERVLCQNNTVIEMF